jgi:hypothetical protein
LLREDGRRITFEIPAIQRKAPKNKKAGKYPPIFVNMNSPIIGPIIRPEPAAVSAYPIIFSLLEAKVEVKIE